ncbi:hypothetical protein Tco_1379687, partial [Tanacetum coccineum]
DSQDSRSGERRQAPPTHECTYSDFLKCQLLNFKGTEGVVGLTQWFKKMESVFHISNCTVACQIKFATCILQENALTWQDKKPKIELWNLKVKGTDVLSYNQRFQELALMCSRMFPKESDEVEKYVGGLPDMIQGSVMTSKPKTMQEAIEIANDLMNQKIHTFTERYERKEYAGTLPLCNKCKFHHTGLCTRTLTFDKCGNQGHYRNDCLELKNQNHGNQARGTKARGMVYALGGGEADQDLDNIEVDINA